MNPYLHLMWKEYCAVRLFWIAVVVLVTAIGALSMAFASSSAAVQGILCGLALGGPVLFAIGCTGASYAVEKEEGTFEFLRAAPVAAKHLLVSKLGIAVLATLAMYLVLWPLAFIASHGTLNEYGQLRAMLELWLVAALEAIAWGTLFSLLAARPLVAVILAITFATTSAHGMALFARDNHNNAFELIAYVRVAPWRALLASVVLLVDVVLGLRWLDQGKIADRKRSKTMARTASTAVLPAEKSRTELRSELVARKPDRSARLAHLLWQHWRQSRGFMFIFGGGQIVLPILIASSFGQLVSDKTGQSQSGFEIALVSCLAVIAALMGTVAFLPDQERRNYRFLAEHNVPPRTVWLTRLVPWLIILCVSTFIVGTFPMLVNGTFRQLRVLVEHSANWWHYRDTQYPYVYLPPLGMGLACVAVSFAAGQWVSMLVRSGILAGFLSLLLGSLLCGWVLLMQAMDIGFWWTVAPIPVVLLVASWLRAPDWILERTTWRARAKGVAVVAVPTIAMFIAVPVFRVEQVRLVSPGFNPTEFAASITPEALETGEMYRKASDPFKDLDEEAGEQPMTLSVRAAFERRDDERSQAHSRRQLLADDLKLLEQNKAAIATFLEASSRPSCAFGKPGTVGALQVPRNAYWLLRLVIFSGWQLEAEGKLDEAMDRYFSALQASNHLFANGMSMAVYRELIAWGAAKNQTSERIGKALQQLQAGDSVFNLARDQLKVDYILARRAILDDASLLSAGLYRDPSSGELLWGRLMPWENDRAARVLNLLCATALQRLDAMQNIAPDDESETFSMRTTVPGYNWLLPPNISHDRKWLRPDDLDEGAEFFSARYPVWGPAEEEARWLRSTRPNLHSLGYQGQHTAAVAAQTEANRRAALIVLALEAYRIDRGELPKELSALTGKYLEIVPVDPYSGFPFRYFRDGLPLTDEAEVRAKSGSTFVNGVPLGEGGPGIWCTGTRLGAVKQSINNAGEPVDEFVRYWLRQFPYSPAASSIEQVLELGSWFPIPAVPSDDDR